jgi:hypothetical protein
MRYDNGVSPESLKAIESLECEAGEDLARSRFRRLFNEIEQLRASLDELASDLESSARRSFARSAETFQSDWRVEDPDGHARWSRARLVLGDGA